MMMMFMIPVIDKYDNGQVILMDATVAKGAAAMMAICLLMNHDE